MRSWARCNDCGGEVVFDAWVTLSGEVHGMFDENICTGCDRPNVKYTETIGDCPD